MGPADSMRVEQPEIGYGGGADTYTHTQSKTEGKGLGETVSLAVSLEASVSLSCAWSLSFRGFLGPSVPLGWGYTFLSISKWLLHMSPL